jgi:hypothetical protein
MDKRQLIGLKCMGLDLQKVKKFNESIQIINMGKLIPPWVKG